MMSKFELTGIVLTDEHMRKGASRAADIPPEILAGLNIGTIEAATLAENTATDFSVLVTATMPELSDKAQHIDPRVGITKRMAQVSHLISEAYGQARLDWLSKHPSDLLRGWAAYLIALDDSLSLTGKIHVMRPLADDQHFGVREWAWLALRPEIARSPGEALEALEPFVSEPSERLRRFACEAIRPRGVWAVHITHLKTNPDLGLPILEPLRADRSRYVQDSVANWLNDAWKDQPEWVETLCARWSADNSSAETAYIVKRALRSSRSISSSGN